jgi:HPt (histidine-containing phosphotransfer) domain-containing protein
MKAASLSEIKKELGYLDLQRVQELCMRLAKYKKENKELLTYLLFEAHDEPGYINNVKREIDEHFDTLPKGNVYFIKKSLRKILRITNKQIKYSGAKQTELELRIYFCSKIKKSGIQLLPSQVLFNLYHQQLKKIETALAKLPEDLQYDYHQELEQLK